MNKQEKIIEIRRILNHVQFAEFIDSKGLDKYAKQILELSPDEFILEELLNAVQWTYRKHHMGDDSIGWNELSDLLNDTLFNVMGANELEKWRDSIDR
jgi:hypothetical protein